jgi:two-component system cell cycle response regulator
MKKRKGSGPEIPRGEAPPDSDDDDQTMIVDRANISWPSEPNKDETCHVLTRLNGADRGRSYVLSQPAVRLGRGLDCEVRVNDESVSRVHATVTAEGGGWVLEDAGSRNGTFVEERKVRRYELRDGDELQLGTRARFRFASVARSEVELMKELFESSVQDSLTGARNRRSFDARLRTDFAFAQRHGTDLAVLMLDLDHFKRVNDTFGHFAGDAVLREVALTVRRTIRTEDFFARYGGEELVILAPGIDVRGGYALGERIRSTIEGLSIEVGDQSVPVGKSNALCKSRQAPGHVAGAA